MKQGISMQTVLIVKHLASIACGSDLEELSLDTQPEAAGHWQ